MKEVPFSGKDAEKASEDFAKKRGAGEGRVRKLRTYRADVEELITKKKVTRTHVAIAEEERRRAIGESAVWEQEKPTSMIPLITAGVFLLVGVSILFYDLTGRSFTFFSINSPVKEFVIPGDKTEIVALSKYTRDELTRGIRTIARNRKLPQGDHVRIAFQARTGTSSLPLPINNFFSTLEADVPDIFRRSLSLVYEGGLISAGETKGYLVFTTTYYENSVVGLLSWERRMVPDLYPVIDPLRAELLSGTIEGSWKAQVWGGHDLRVFTTTDGRVALVYGWIDRKTLIITGNVQAFTELARSMAESATDE